MNKFTPIPEHSESLEKMPLRTKEKWAMHLYKVRFGKQPLELGQFVPVDEQGNVMEPPMTSDYRVEHGSVPKFPQECYEFDCKEYQKAKDKVLFKNVEVRKYSNGDINIEVSGNLLAIYIRINKEWKFSYEVLEDLTELGLELTGNHLKS